MAKKAFYDQEKVRIDIRKRRIIELDENQKDFCKRSAISLGSLNKIEAAKPVTIGIIINVCSANNLDYKKYLL